LTDSFSNPCNASVLSELGISVDEDGVAGKESYLIAITFAKRFLFNGD
jgi:hypothetical protein